MLSRGANEVAGAALRLHGATLGIARSPFGALRFFAGALEIALERRSASQGRMVVVAVSHAAVSTIPRAGCPGP